MHKKTRRNSALLLLMAPIIAIGSSALVAGTAASAGATAKKAISPSIKICEPVPGAFRFVLNGSVVSLNGKCEVFKAKIGVNHVTEISAPALYRSLSSISVTPAQVRVNSSLKTESITLRLAAGKSATVMFANSKLVVVVSGPAPVNPPPSNPLPVSPPPSAGGGSPGGGGPAPVGNPDPVSTGGTGDIEVCKTAADPMVEGTFDFTISAGGTLIASPTLTLAPISRETDANTVCTGSIPVPAGTVTVTEATYGPGYWLQDVTANPLTALLTVDTTTQTATFNVVADQETTGDFIDATQLNTIKVCKTLANNLGNLGSSTPPTTFSYNVEWSFTPATTGGPYATYTGGTSVSVVAVPFPGTACSIVGESIPAGATVWVTENNDEAAAPYVSVSNVSIVPSQFDAATPTTPADEAVLTVPPVEPVGFGGYADAVFTNTPMGFIEVCKYFDPSNYDNAGNWATFTVNGGSPFTVDGGDCSAPIEVPAGIGTATVYETVGADYAFEGVSATSDSGVVDELTGPEWKGVSTSDPAVVSVPYGGIGNETMVNFFDSVDPTTIKICAQDTTVDTNTAGAPLYVSESIGFSYTHSDGSTGSLSVPVDQTAGNPTGLNCKAVSISEPEFILTPAGDAYTATITETGVTVTAPTPAPPTVEVTGISYAGNGTWSNDTAPGLPASIEVQVATGTNMVTFTNGPPPVE